jgi:hypothetical protein
VITILHRDHAKALRTVQRVILSGLLPDGPRRPARGLLAHVCARERGQRLGRRFPGTQCSEIPRRKDVVPRQADFLHQLGWIVLYVHPGMTLAGSDV